MIFGAGFVAGTINVMAAGGSLITLPLLLFLGFPAALANGTNRVAILFQSLVAVRAYRRHGVSDVARSWRLGFAAVPGAVAGAVVAIQVSEGLFRILLAIVILAGVVITIFPATVETAPDDPPIGGLVYLAFFAIGFYGGFVQAGVGMAFLLVLHQGLKLNLVRVNAYKVFVIGVYTVPALAVFIWSGNVDWRAGLVLAAGNGSGAWLGTRIAVTGGDRIIRIVLALALALMAARLVVP
jgi:uncharacterized protein